VTRRKERYLSEGMPPPPRRGGGGHVLIHVDGRSRRGERYPSSRLPPGGHHEGAPAAPTPPPLLAPEVLAPPPRPPRTAWGDGLLGVTAASVVAPARSAVAASSASSGLGQDGLAALEICESDLVMKCNVARVHTLGSRRLGLVELREQVEGFEAFGRVSPAQGVTVRATLQGLDKGLDPAPGAG
jgi:hypothetical protein